MVRTMALRLALVVFAALAGGGHPLVAQEVASQNQTAAPKSIALSEADYAQWELLVARAEEAIAAGRASNPALNSLRAEIVGWRARFLAAQGQNVNAIETLKDQIATLGPVPDGTTEAPELANQRVALNNRLTELTAPVRAAEVAYGRAEGLIRGIDRIVRERQAGELMRLGPSPLNPANWGVAVTTFMGSGTAIWKEVATAWRNPVQMSESRDRLPRTIFLFLISVVLLSRGRHWMEVLATKVQKEKTAGRWLASFALSLGQVGLPFLGVMLFVESLFSTGLVGLRGEQLAGAMLVAGFAFFSAHWLGARNFPKSDTFELPLNLPPERRREGRFFAGALGLVVGLALMVQSMGRYDNWPEAAKVVILFPFLVVAGLMMIRLARLLQRHVRNEDKEGEERSYRNRLIYLLGRILVGLAWLGIIAAAVGYFEAGQGIVFPTIMSLQLIALLMVLQRLVSEIYAMITGNREGAREALLPVLAGFTLVLTSLPVFALVWGAKTTDLTEMWGRFSSGVSIGETRISPASFLTFAVIFAAGYIFTRLLQGTLKSSILPKTKIDPGGQNAIVSGLGYVGIFLSALVAVTGAGIDLSGLAIVAGALSVGIGFGLQNIVSNFVSGIILLIERPISEGDWIEVGGKQGYVRDISVRSTRIETFDRTDVIVPNADFVSGMVTNYTRGKTLGRVIVPVGVAYGCDTRQVEEILRKIAESHPMVLANPAPAVIFMGFGADSLDFEIRVILRDVNWSLSVRSEMNHRIYKRFQEEGIEIPFAQRDIWIRNPEALQGRAAPTVAKPAEPEVRDWADADDAIRACEDDVKDDQK